MSDPFHTLLLTPDEMNAADAAASVSGIDSFGLMERAGQAVAAAALRLYPQAKQYIVLCGPGNNGGDGYVAARALLEAGAKVSVYTLIDPSSLRADAAVAFSRFTGETKPLESYEPASGDVLIDAVFGAGLSKPVPDLLAMLIENVNGQNLPVVAVDLPSGLCGRTGTIRGSAFKAAHTVTFMTTKPGHLLLPGRTLCGPVEIFDIGIPERIIRASAGKYRQNHPDLWQLPIADEQNHKFRRGHLGVFAGSATTSGAARLSAMAGLRTGAGLVTISAPKDALPVVAAHLTAIMLKEVGDISAVADWVSDPRLSAFVLGPGFGINQFARDIVKCLEGRPMVLDADGISAFVGNPEALFPLLKTSTEPKTVMTPHEGEFARLFPDIARKTELGKVSKALDAASRANAIIVYKGADTVIASPDGRAYINTNAPPWLATAGSGDVLAGIIGGLLAQGMNAFDAAAAGVFLHGQAGMRAGKGLTAEDLPLQINPF